MTGNYDTGHERFLLICVMLSLLIPLMAGCALRRPADLALPREMGPRLDVARDGDASALSWVGRDDREYTVLYTDDLMNPAWRPLDSCRHIRGRNGKMHVRDTSSNGKMRYYRLHVRPHAGDATE